MASALMAEPMVADSAQDKQGCNWLISAGTPGIPAALKIITSSNRDFAWTHIARGTEWFVTHTSISVDKDGSKQGVDDDGNVGSSYACVVKGYQTAYLWLNVGAGSGTVSAELWGGLTTTCETLLGIFESAQAGGMGSDEYAVFELSLKGAAYTQVKLIYSESTGSIVCNATLVVQS